MRKAVSRRILGVTVVVASGLLMLTKGQAISCPILSCDQQLTLDQCFQHDNQMPVETIRTFSCDTYSVNSTLSNPLCELNLNKVDYAWYSETT